MKRYFLVVFYSLLAVLLFRTAFPYSAFAISKYVVTDLGTVHATALNNSGAVVGCSNNHAFLWSSETGMQDLGTLYGGSSCAHDINDLNYVVGNQMTGHSFGNL